MKIAAAAVLAAASSSAAMAGGFMLTEQSVAGLGRAYAGAGIVGDDSSAVWYNPAGMTLLSGTQFQLGGVFADLDLPLKSADGSYTDNGRKYVVPIPNMFLVHQMNEDMWFGLGITVPFGMATEYNRDSEFNDYGMNSEIKVFDFNPNIAWKINEKFSLGAGISLQYATAQFETAQSNTYGYGGYGRINADSFAWGANIGAMWSPTETLRFCLAYRSAVNHNASGTYRVGVSDPANGSPNWNGYLGVANDATARITAPQSVSLTGTWEATDNLRLSALIRWADWSTFDKLVINGKLGGVQPISSSVVNEWNDAWLFTVGADYTINSAWTVRAGVGYEFAPVEDKHRTAVIPDADRLWLALGATWHVNENLQGDFGFAWLHGLGDMGLYDDEGIKEAEFEKLECYLIGAQFVYKF